MLSKITRCLSVCVSAIMLTGTCWGIVDLTTGLSLHTRCKTIGTIELNMPGVGAVKMFKINSLAGGTSDPMTCYDADRVLALAKAAGMLNLYSVVAVYDIVNKKVIFPTASLSNFDANAGSGASLKEISYSSSLPVYDEVPMFGNGEALISMDMDSYYLCNALGRRLVVSFAIAAVIANNPSGTVYITGVATASTAQAINSSLCIFDRCNNGNEIGWFFVQSACCTGGCPANQYGNGCTCTDCPTMVNKAGQTVSGTSDEDDNIRIGDCTMGTSHVFSDASGDWSFNQACQASL